MTKKTKKIILITACVLVLAIAAAIIISSFVGFQPKGVNLIKNVGVEDVHNGLPLDWYTESYKTGAFRSIPMQYTVSAPGLKPRMFRPGRGWMKTAPVPMSLSWRCFI